MSKEMKYLVFAIEAYRRAKGLSGKQVADLFAAHEIYQLILDNYFLYHIESPEHMIEEIDNYMTTGNIAGEVAV